MKKKLLLVAIVATTLNSCSKNEVITSNLDNQALSFGVYTGTTTKSGEVTTTSLATHGFGVFVNYEDFVTGTTSTSTAQFSSTTSTPNFMYNQAVYGYLSTDTNNQITGYETTADYWDYTPRKYWPNNTTDVLTFFAYGPYSSNTTGTDCITFNPVTANYSGSSEFGSDGKTAMVGIPEINYTLLDNAKTADLVVAAPYYNQTNTSAYNANSGAKSFAFKHTLTRAKFSAYLDVTFFNTGSTATSETGSNNANSVSDTTQVYVTKLVILGADYATTASTKYYDKTGTAFSKTSGGLYKSNTFTYNDAASAGATTVATGGDIEGVGSWGTATAMTEDYDLANLLDITTTAFSANLDGVYCAYRSPNGVLVDDKADVEGGLTNLFKDAEGTEGYIFLLPVGSTGNSSPTGIGTSSEVYVYIEYDVVTLDPKLASGYSKVTNRDIITLPEGTLKLGSAYNYVLTIGMDEVTVSATVEAWDETSEYATVATPSTYGNE